MYFNWRWYFIILLLHFGYFIINNMIIAPTPDTAD